MSAARGQSAPAPADRESRLVARFELRRPEFALQAEIDVPLGGVTAIFGPSGCGKTTLLRCIAGLERARPGYLRVGEALWQDDSRGLWVPVHRRAVGFVFQEPRLFPHLNVGGNLRYGFARTPPAERGVAFEHVVEVLGLAALLARRPPDLSGGEQQRVAIGRALLASPRLLLLDEPLASLDLGRKREILSFIGRLHPEFGIPILYVSHAVGEVLQLATTVVLLAAGRVAAVGPLQEVFARRELRATLAGAAAGSVLETTVVEHEVEYALTRVAFRGHRLEVPHRNLPVGAPLRVHVLPRDVTLHLDPPERRTSALNRLPATVVEIPDPGADAWSVEVRLDVGAPLFARITRKSLAALALHPGQQVWAQIKAVALADELAE